MSKIIIIFFCFLPFIGWSKDYRVKLEVKNLPADSRPILLRIYNGNLIFVDTIPTRSQDTLLFKVPDNTPPGTLRSILGFPPYAQFSGKGPIYLDFLFNHEDIELTLDYDNPQASAKVIRSAENQIYFDFLKSENAYSYKLGLIENIVVNYPDKDAFYRQASENYRKFQLQRNKLIEEEYRKYPNTLAGKLIKNQKVPIIAGGKATTLQERDSMFRHHFLSQIDFSDTVLLYTPFYTDKVFQYIQLHMNPQSTPRENEAHCIEALDHLVPFLSVNPIVQQNLLHFLINGFEQQKMEEVLAHISTHYLQQCGDNRDIIKRRLEGYSKMAVGQIVPDFTTTDIHNDPVNLYSTLNPYILVLFWHTQCNHCQNLMTELLNPARQEELAKRQIRIIGVSVDEDKEEWEKFSAHYGLDWINTYTEAGFESPVASDFNLFATPSMFLLDENFKIIAKPTTVQELDKNISEIKD